VQQGDHLSKIARIFGFVDYTTIWNDPNNAKLKQKRQNPHVLYPGDQIYVADLQARDESCPTDLRHNFEARTTSLKLRLVLEDHYEGPIGNASCDLILDGQSGSLTTDSNGEIEQTILPTVRDGLLILKDPQTPAQNIAIPLKVGDLDPVEEVSGQQARLANLGYLAGSSAEPDERHMNSAVEEFQCDHGLTVDGICGPKTQAKLKQVHGS
jgi:N-acetylmuramoyl-L-alanine amidase